MKRKPYSFKHIMWVSLTQKCNWKCWYCDHPLIKGPKHVTEKELEEFIEILRPYVRPHDVELSVEGGEIGLMPTSILDMWFNSDLSDTYAVTTNGLFMEKGYHDLYKDKIHHILYHVVPELEQNTVLKNYQFDPSIDVLYTVVIHKGNIQYLDDFLSRNRDVNFLPHFLQPRRENLEFMDIEEFQQIKNILLKYCDNIPDYLFRRLDYIIGSLNNQKKMSNLWYVCSNIYDQVIINVPLNVIHRCCITMQTDSVPITSENINSILNYKQIYPKNDKVCQDCIANFVWMCIEGGTNHLKKIAR